MSKRMAQGPQGAKETGLDFNMSSTPDDKPQRATAAQLANRRIKAINRRTRPGSPAAPSTQQSQSFSPFTSLDPNTVSSTSSGSQPPSLTNGFAFGQSQSFPGAGSSPAQNGTQPVAFGAGAGSGSAFNFSSSFDTAASVSNPFANMSGGGSNQPSGGSGFGGFKGNMFNLPPTSNQTQNQQTTTSSGLFGSQPQQNGAGGIFGGFGSNTSTASTSPFQSTPATAPSTGGIFGQAGAQSTAPASNVFGQGVANKPSPFGNSTAFAAPSDSMQTSPDAKAGTGKPSIFGNGGISQPPPSFGASPAFGGSSAKPLFGSTTSENKTTFSTGQTTQPLFGAKPVDSSTSTTTTTGNSLFGRISQPDSSAPATTAATTTTATPAATTPLFGTGPAAGTPTTTFQPFQSSSIFPGVSKPETTQPAPASGNLFSLKRPEESKPGEIKAPDTTSVAEPKKDGVTAQPAAGLFGTTSGFSTAQPTSNMFAPKPTSDADQSASQTPAANPFTGLFSMKPAAQPAPAQDKTQTIQSESTNIFAPKPAGTAADSAKSATFTTSNTTSNQQTSTPKPASLFAPPPSESPASSGPTISTSSTATTSGQDAFKVKGAASKTSTPAIEAGATTPKDKASAPKVSFAAKGPRGLPSNLSKELGDDVELLYRVRMLNESFKRKISELDPSKDDFDLVVSFYVRVRETIGAPIGEFRSTTSKRKMRDDEERIDTGAPSQKKAKPAEKTALAPVSPASKPSNQTKPGPSANIFSTSPLKPAASTEAVASNKRKATEDVDSSTGPSPQQEKRTKNAQTGESTTASIFASSFSSSQNSNSVAGAPKDADTTSSQNAQPLFGAKPVFPTPAAGSQAPGGVSPASSTPIFKPLFPQTGTSIAPSIQSPFSLKPSLDKTTESTAKPAFGVPKFGSGSGTNFLSQFKQQAEKEAEKEKAKRKAEDFDSDEDDEAEWERKDAEEQRKKREKLEALTNKRTKLVPGKGFVFEEEDKAASTESPQGVEKAATSAAPATPSTSSSIFSSTRSRSPPKSNNIFGHLSATNSEAEGEEEDSEKGSSYAPSRSDESSGDRDMSGEAEPKALPGPDSEGSGYSSDDGDIAKALKKKSEEAAAAKKTTSGATTPLPAPTPQSGRSLFDRIQYDQDGKPKRQVPEGDAQPSEGKKDSGNPLSTLFGNSKFASSFNTPASASPSIFAQNSKPASGQDNISASNTGSIFGSSVNTTGGIFGSPAPPVFGASNTSTGDNTWKIDSPIKFGNATTAAGASSSATPGGDPSKPFSTLFGGSATQKTTANSGQSPSGPNLGFAFGGPAQNASSLLAPSTGTSATPSRSTTPGVTTDTGADDSADGDAAPAEPQVDLARSRAGEEEEDMVLETRARALKLEPGSGWQSRGVGWLRILKHKTTSRSRILLRADPSGKVVLNASLVPQINYKESGNSVQFLVPKAGGAPESWAIRVKKEEVSRLAATMEKCKA